MLNYVLDVSLLLNRILHINRITSFYYDNATRHASNVVYS